MAERLRSDPLAKPSCTLACSISLQKARAAAQHVSQRTLVRSAEIMRQPRSATKSRPEHWLLLLLPALTACWWLCQLYYWSQTNTQTRRSHITSFSSSVAVANSNLPTTSVLLITALQQCTQQHGQYFLTKAVQSKMAFARSRGWEFITVDGGQIDAAAEAGLLASGETAWPGLIHQMISSSLQQSRPQSDWIVWMGAELLVASPEAFGNFPELPQGIDLVLLPDHSQPSGGDGSATAAASADAPPVLELSLALVRTSKRALELLAAWADAIGEAGATTAASATQQLSSVLHREGWHERVQFEELATARRWLQPMSGGEWSPGGLISTEAQSNKQPWLISFRSCQLCTRPRAPPAEGEYGAIAERRRGAVAATATAAATTPSCSGMALMRTFTAADDALSLRALGAEHSASGSIHVRPAGGGWLSRHRGTLGRRLPSLLVVGSQRSALGSLHWALRRGWHPRIRVNEAGERDVHFFSMDNRFRLGLGSHGRRWANATRAGGGQLLLAEVSSSYFDYPKAPARVAAVLPHARVVVLLREPVSRALSAFNFRWLTWLCGKLIWSRADCWAAVTSEAVIKEKQVGPFQVRAALKLWRTCSAAPPGGASTAQYAPSVRCLQRDYVAKLRNKTATELGALSACLSRAERPDTPASVDWHGCLQLRSVMLGPKQVHKALEDSSFIFRSMYATHLRSWLRLFDRSQLLVADPASMLTPGKAEQGMRRLARFAGAPIAGVAINDDVLRRPSPGAEELGERAGVHENARRCVLGKRAPPIDVASSIERWLKPHNCDLAWLLVKNGLLNRARGEAEGHGGADGDATSQLPWLRDALTEATGLTTGGICDGVHSVSEWFVGAS